MVDEFFKLTIKEQNEGDENDENDDIRHSVKLFIVDIHQLQPHEKKKDYYNFYGLPIQHTFIMGVITEVTPIGQKMLYRVDDGSGEINCIHNHLKKLEAFEELRNVMTRGIDSSRDEDHTLNDTTNIDDTITNDNADEMKETAAELFFKFMTTRWNEMLDSGRTLISPFRLGDTIKCYGFIGNFKGKRQLWLYEAYLVTDYEDELLWKKELNFLYKRVYSKLPNPKNG